VSETLLTIAADPKHLGAAIGFLAVLHTWGQNLHLHPHLHCVVSGGGISPDGARWIGCGETFFLPVRVLSCRFRNTFLIYLRESFREGKLQFHGEMSHLAAPAAFEALCCEAKRIKWVVFAKPPFGGPGQVLKYLARYTHRVAISNSRILSIDGGRVTFKWKDYAGGNKTGTMTLDAVEFIRRFLLHIVPTGFVRIRQFGFLANRVRAKKLELCRAMLGAPPTPAVIVDWDGKTEGQDRKLCPACKVGHLILISVVRATRLPQSLPRQDSS
jgi:Putative transposase